MNKTQIMGIVNVTPDSFSDGNTYFAPTAAIQHVEELFRQGAALVDIGAESTRPHATPLTPDEEWERLEPVLAYVLPKYTGQISIDSRHPETIARVAQVFGPHFTVNDVTGFNDPEMIKITAQHGLHCIVSHLPSQVGTDIQAAHTGPLVNDIEIVKSELLTRHAELVDAGIPAAHILLDPGIGFGKTPELNTQLLKFPALLPDYPVLLGYSRKRFLGDNRFDIEVNLAAARVAIDAGAAFLRVHDAAAHVALLRSIES
jgi:dihydropteroate synthase